jgi:putative ABC transport system permease protein
VLTFGLPLRGDRYATRADVVRFEDDLLDRIRRLPGVRSVGAAYAIPMANMSTTSFRLEGAGPSTGPAPQAGYNAVAPGYFETLRIPVVAGRDFTPQDRPESPGVVIVNRAFVNRYLAGRSAIGRRLRSGPAANDAPMVEIVGVVGDIRRASVDEPPVPELYFALSQDVTSSPMFVVAGSSRVVPFLEPIRRVVRDLDPALPLARPMSLRQVVDAMIARPRFLSVLLGIFAVLALTLVGLGVNGVIAFVVAERTKEIGVRRALGAGVGSVFADVLRRGLVPVLVGLGAGLLLALGLGPLIRSLLYGVEPRDPVTFGLVLVVILGAGLAGCLIPARRAVRVDPLTALRE